MSSVEIKILGQQFLINPPDDKVDLYKKIAADVNKMMTAESGKAELRSDLKVAIKFAFILALENHSLKEDCEKIKGRLGELNSLLDSCMDTEK